MSFCSPARSRRQLKTGTYPCHKRSAVCWKCGNTRRTIQSQAIMRETGIGRASVRKWIRLSELPTRNRMAPRPGMPDFYREYLRRRWAEGCQSGRRLMAEIQPLGYVGCYAGLAKLLARWREPAPVRRNRPTDNAPIESAAPIACVPVRHVSPQIAAALLSQPSRTNRCAPRHRRGVPPETWHIRLRHREGAPPDNEMFSLTGDACECVPCTKSAAEPLNL